MQIPPYLRGEHVRVRGARWRVDDVRPFASCTVVTLSSGRDQRQLIHPFDAIDRIDAPRRPRVVGIQRWRQACRHLLAGDTPPGSLRVARDSRIDLMAHQLEPAMAVLAGRGCRVLLADGVGLGKTVEAGLIVAELRARGWIDRVLVLTPAGLRDQWRHELRDRFAIDAAILDGRGLRRMAATLPIGLNPWSTMPSAIASIDYVKRAEVLPAVAGARWDALLVDEAHGVDGDSDRRHAVATLAARASYVVLLTATPHDGDRRSFASLCGLGACDPKGDSLLVFRRSRQDVRLDAPRRVHTLTVGPNAAERRMHALLTRYSDAVREERGDAWLAVSVLHKRAFSGAWALHQSVIRRLSALEEAPEPDDGVEQMMLPLLTAGETTDADAAPDWPEELRLSDPRRERALLSDLADAAQRASAVDSKVRALRRVLRRAGESAIVFTEYRDTLLHLRDTLAQFRSVVLHGGLTRDEREAALDTFAREPATVLLATDAAGEGLNLHRTCRLVVNLELPWNPMRLEQRAGRVDRIGQTRTVHAFHFVFRRTGEERILARLRARIAIADEAIGAPNPLGDASHLGQGFNPSFVARGFNRSPVAQGFSPAIIARLVVDDAWDSEAPAPESEPDPDTISPLIAVDLRDAALEEVERVRCSRAIGDGHDDGSDPSDGRAPWIVCASRTKLRATLGSNALLLWRVAWENASGATLESLLVPLLVYGLPRFRRHANLKVVANALVEHLGPGVERCSADWSKASAEIVHSLAAARLARERLMLRNSNDHTGERFQAGLFDGRADRARRLQTRLAEQSRGLVAERLQQVEEWASLRGRSPELVLAVLP
jgi:superfamily II DNA or RNA helicase